MIMNSNEVLELENEDQQCNGYWQGSSRAILAINTFMYSSFYFVRMVVFRFNIEHTDALSPSVTCQKLKTHEFDC